MMNVHIPDGAKWFILAAFLVMMLPRLAFATPFIWVDTVNGSDTEVYPDYMSPTHPLWSYHQAILNGADGDTLGVKVKPGSALPSADEAFIINSRKPDRVRTAKPKQEVIPGHGLLPMGDVETSAEAGLKITTDRVWVTYTAPNGQLAEYETNPNITVEAY